MENVLITGANRGIGLELCRQLLAQGDLVFAGCRRPLHASQLQAIAAANPRLRIITLDVTNDEQVQDAAAIVAGHTDHLNLLINNAGIFPRGERLDGFDAAQMLRVFDVNVAGTMRVTSAFAPLLRRGRNPRIVNISSQLGSLARMDGNWGDYSYNSSKAALNMITRKMSHELGKNGITAVAVHPGWVQTDMGGASATLTVPESARGILTVAAGLTAKQSGQFFTYAGKEHPW